MKMELKKASRKQMKIKIGLAGSAGSGKTTAALLLAYGITNDWSKIAMIDAENRSSELYVGQKIGDNTIGEFNVIHLTPPFTPESYVEAIEVCENEQDIEIIIIDSMSHEWDGKGGILEIHTNMPGNSFTNWGKLTPRHNRFIDKIVQSKKFIICTMRTKQDYVLVEKNGKQVPEKVGLKAITREGVDYEFTLCFDIDIKHNAVASKDRTSLFMDKPDFVVSPQTGKKILDWCNTGELFVSEKENLQKEYKSLVDSNKSVISDEEETLYLAGFSEWSENKLQEAIKKVTAIISERNSLLSEDHENKIKQHERVQNQM